MQNPSKDQQKKWHNDPKNWKFFGIYYNKEDQRIFVPKAFYRMGITLNFANPVSYFIILLVIGILAFLVSKS